MFASSCALTHVYIYIVIYTRVQITNTRSCLSCEARWRRNAHPELNQRNVLSEALQAPTLVRSNRRADMRAHTPGPYFNHKLMFRLLRICIIVRENLLFFPLRPPFAFSRLTQTEPTATSWHRRHRRRGWYQWRWLVTKALMDIHEREYTQHICYVRTRYYRWTGCAPVKRYLQEQYSYHFVS